mgnify:CR=1 FL=1
MHLSISNRTPLMTNKEQELTPMMKQFYQLKAKHPDAVLLFRCGDFYETYCEDAVVAAKILGITLTRRNKGGTEMAGFPYHALDVYLPKLVRAGKRVAICDQLEDPKLTKKLVKRGITELVTPGVAMTDNVLNHKENNFLAALAFPLSTKKKGDNKCGVAFLDISTGEFFVSEGNTEDIDKLLINFQPKEILFERGNRPIYDEHFSCKTYTYELDDWVFVEQTSRQKLQKHFGVENLKGFGVENFYLGVTAAGAILQYLEMTQHEHISHICSLSRIDEERYVRLDRFTINSLEIISPMQEGGTTLLSVLDRTVTPMGGRLLRRWLVFPLNDIKAINSRLEVVESLKSDNQLAITLDDQLQRLGDLERIISKVAVGRVSPREVLQLKQALFALVPIKEACVKADNAVLQKIGEQLFLCEDLRERIEKEISDEAPQMVNKGGVIKEGFHQELDELRQMAYNGKDYLLKIQEREAQQTGISSLKIGYNNVFGYYLEVRNLYKEMVPADWVRKQTLAQAERYITQELKEYEEKILGAEDKILILEGQLYNELVNYMQGFIRQIQTNASLLAQIDCVLSFAKVSEENHYVKPEVNDTMTIDICQGRHPVIEKRLAVGNHYVPNDILLNKETQQIMMITGPNMAGKSALLRQTALIVLMAQVGCYVPAESAKIGLVDKIFTRVGASDNISLGESTFMVEMTEASNILNNVTPRSLVLFDELGRGTSTYDGISIAWAIVEYLHETPKAQARTLFATHYHELNEMEKTFPRIANYNVSVREDNGKVLFLRKLKRGGSEHSFGIHVARLAGMNKDIVNRADEVLKILENAGASATGIKSSNAPVENIKTSKSDQGYQLSIFQLDDPVLSEIRDEIKGLDVNNMTPMEALNKLAEIKKICGLS